MRWIILAAAGVLMSPAGCVNIRTPDVDVRLDGAEPVDSAHVPHPSTLEEAQADLDRAYSWIAHLERENRRQREKREEAERDAKKYKQERDRYKDRLDD